MEHLIKSTAILSLFYIFYKLFLQNETFFQSIRSYFLIGVATAIILPFIIIPEYVVFEPVSVPVKLYVGSISQTLESRKVDWSQILLIRCYHFFFKILNTIKFFTLVDIYASKNKRR